MSYAKYINGQPLHQPAALDDSGKVINAGYDTSETVQKVAMMVWNPASLGWERGTSAGGSGGSSPVVTTRRIDESAASIYVGEAAVGTAEIVTGWSIKKVELVNGNAVAVKFATGTWATRAVLVYQ